MRRSLRRAFRRVCWVGPPPVLPDKPVILYANHHSFYDGYFAWLLASEWLGRPVTTWMDKWHEYPLFAPIGAQPFPADDSAQRVATIRRTARRFAAERDLVLVYFPEGHLHPPEDGIAPFSSDALARLARLLPGHAWWPVAIHVTWWGEAYPTALLTGGPPHEAISGREHDLLESLWTTLRAPVTDEVTVLLDGRAGPDEAWNMRSFSPLFERHL